MDVAGHPDFVFVLLTPRKLFHDKAAKRNPGLAGTGPIHFEKRETLNLSVELRGILAPRQGLHFRTTCHTALQEALPELHTGNFRSPISTTAR